MSKLFTCLLNADHDLVAHSYQHIYQTSHDAIEHYSGNDGYWSVATLTGHHISVILFCMMLKQL